MLSGPVPPLRLPHFPSCCGRNCKGALFQTPRAPRTVFLYSVAGLPSPGRPSTRPTQSGNCRGVKTPADIAREEFDASASFKTTSAIVHKIRSTDGKNDRRSCASRLPPSPWCQGDEEAILEASGDDSMQIAESIVHDFSRRRRSPRSRRKASTIVNSSPTTASHRKI